MKPEEVKPASFKEFNVVLEEEYFSVAYGIDSDGNKRFAMRWNGEGDNKGYPNQGGNPLWFQMPHTGIWTQELLRAVGNIKDYEKRLKEMEP